tara:strand:- start:344 stop:832 length:489 start_codon:yes stop_codon:yes gene_type:complete
MKLLATIAALLLSFSAFSQDYIEYRDFKFYHNGAEISFEDVSELTYTYGVAKTDFKRGMDNYAISQQGKLRARGRNLINGYLTISGCCVSLLGFAVGQELVEDGVFPIISGTVFTLSTISAGIALNSARYLGTKKEFGKRADNNFSDTAQQLNEVIQLGKSQ